MTEKKTGTAQSVRDRLYNISRERNESLQSLLVRYALERLLYRFGRSKYVNELVLKGAFLLTYWAGQSYRTTKDLDILARGSDDRDRIRDIFREICAIDVVPDGLLFDTEDMTIEEIREGETYQGLRLKFRALLGKAIIPLQIDLGFGDVIVPKASTIEYTSLLDFPAPRILAYPPESVISEKVEAMVKLGMDNSRMKDFYDVYFLLSFIDLNRNTLKKAIEKTFERRGTEIPRGIPQAFSEEFATDEIKINQWRSFIERNSLSNAPEDLAEALDEIKNLVVPIFEKIHRKS